MPQASVTPAARHLLALFRCFTHPILIDCIIMKKVLTLIACLLLFTFPAHALFLLENDDVKRPGRSGVAFGQVAGGTALNIHWGIWENTNLYFITGTGLGLGVKQRLIQENTYWPLSLDVTAETTSLKNWHTSAYGLGLRKKLGDDVSSYLKVEAIDNNADWPGFNGLQDQAIVSIGIDWKIWRDMWIILAASDRPETFGTAAVYILL